MVTLIENKPKTITFAFEDRESEIVFFIKYQYVDKTAVLISSECGKYGWNKRFDLITNPSLLINKLINPNTLYEVCEVAVIILASILVERGSINPILTKPITDTILRYLETTDVRILDQRISITIEGFPKA